MSQPVGYYILRVKWDWTHSSRWCGLFDGKTEAEKAAKKIREALRESGRYRRGMVEVVQLADPEYVETLIQAAKRDA